MSPYQSWCVYLHANRHVNVTVFGTRADADSWAKHFSRSDGRAWGVKEIKDEDRQVQMRLYR